MTIGISCLAISFVYLVIMSIVYFGKKRIKNIDNKIYQFMIIFCFLNIIGELACIYTVSHINVSLFITTIVNRVFLISLYLWVFLFTYYILVISFGQKKWINMVVFFALIISTILDLVLPIDFFFDGTYTYSTGTVTEVGAIIVGIQLVFWIFIVFFKRKTLGVKKIVPIILFILATLINLIVNYYNPGLNIITTSEVLVTITMYFTIENPDIKMLEQVELAKEQAERANKAKTDFLSSMSHEIRTPLNAIVGFSQSLKTEDLPASAMEEVDDIIEASETLLDTVNGVLDISKIEANKIEIVDSVYNFHKIFDELVALSKARLGEDKPIEFRYELAEDTPKYLYGDYARVKQVVLNFLTNAIKYTNEGYIDFKVRNITNNGICRLIITVEDSGIGIKKESITKLFDKFERLDNENSTIEGTGLGMAITKKLVELMHGKIVVQSIFGKGSQFMVILDQKLVDEKDIPKEEETTTQTTTSDYSSKKILLVDDNKLNLKVATRLLKPYNVQVEDVDSGFACLDLVGGGNTYDLILMDDMMPKMSGKETFKKLKEDPSFNTPVVILTANAITGMKEQYLADGFNDYLAKPIEKSELERVLRKYLG